MDAKTQATDKSLDEQFFHLALMQRDIFRARINQLIQDIPSGEEVAAASLELAAVIAEGTCATFDCQGCVACDIADAIRTTKGG